MKLNCLAIFDLDGTLFETHSITVPATLKAMDELHLDAIPETRIASLIGLTASEFVEELAPDLRVEEKDDLSSRICQYEKEFLATHGNLYPGIEQVIKDLSNQGFTLAICTNGSIEYAEQVLSKCKIRSYFQHVKSCSKELSKTRTIKLLLENTKKPQAIVIGDSEQDIAGARANRCSSVFATYGYGRIEENKADFVAETTLEVFSSIIRWQVFSHLLVQIDQRKSNHKPVIVGINGVDCSGKTTFAKSFQKWLSKQNRQTELVFLDDFHNPRSKRQEGKNPIDAYFQNAFNLSLLEKEILYPSKEFGKTSCRLTLLDLDTDLFSINKKFTINQNSIVLIEGVLLFREPLDSYFDIRLFIDVCFDEVLERAKKRDVKRFGPEIINSYKNKYIPLQQKYLKEYNPKGRSNIVIDNNNFNFPIISKTFMN